MTPDQSIETTPATPTHDGSGVAAAAICSPPEEVKWLIYDLEWLLEQRNKITVKRNRDVITRALAYLQHIEANTSEQVGR